MSNKCCELCYYFSNLWCRRFDRQATASDGHDCADWQKEAFINMKTSSGVPNALKSEEVGGLNILTALRRCEQGEKIRRIDGEWLTLCPDGSTLWYVKKPIQGKREFHPSIFDILATDWQAENDIRSMSKQQAEIALAVAGISPIQKSQILKRLGFS